jgi:hypothetical protein
MGYNEDLGIENDDLKKILPERVAVLAEAVLQFIALSEKENNNEIK